MNDNFEISSATGVDLKLNIAGPGARSYAFVIDWHIRLLLALAWFAVMHFAFLGFESPPGRDAANISPYLFVVVVPAAAIYTLYHLTLEILMQGRTPGKRMAGVRVVTLDAQVPGLLAHVIRNLLRLVDSMPVAYVIGLISTLVTENAVRIGDIAAGTLLIYETDTRAGTLDVAQLNPELVKRHGLATAELGQDLLNRWDALDEKRRMALALKLLTKIDPSTQPAADSAGLRQQLLNTLGH